MATLDFDKERIRFVRARLGLTQKQFAKKLDVDVTTVISWEKGRTAPNKGPHLGAFLAAEREADAL